MLDSLYIGSYRGINDLQLNDFQNINILVGNNNSGKTSVLEAMILSGLFDDGELLIQTLISRYQQISIDFLMDLFHDRENPEIFLRRKMKEEQAAVHTFITCRQDETTVLKDEQMDLERVLELKLNYRLETLEEEKLSSNYSVVFKEKENSTEVQLRRAKNNTFEAKIPCEFISFSRFDRTNYLINAVDDILEMDKRQALLQVLQIFDSDVENFEVIGKRRDVKIFSKNREHPLSLYDYGNGMYKAFYIASAALLSEGGILLIDEIEAGIHKNALRGFTQYLLQICQSKDIQLFITTHSLETLDLFLEYDNNGLEKVAAYNLRNERDITKVRRYSGEKLAELRKNIGLDVR